MKKIKDKKFSGLEILGMEKKNRKREKKKISFRN